ncbi:MAG: LamG domain-containing protein [Candidatus Saccharimonadales bacterium]
MYTRWQKQMGFTIVELLVVIVVIGVLATITVISFSGIQERAIVASLQSDLNNAAKKLKIDYVLNGAYPATLAATDGGKGINPSLETTYEYVVSNSTDLPGFCIEAVNKGIVYKITENNKPIPGDCDDYGLLLNLDGGDTGSYPGYGNDVFDLAGLNTNITSYDASLGFTENAFDFTATNTDGLNIQNNNFTNLKDFTFEIVFKVNGSHSHYDGALISSGDWNNRHWSFGIGQTNSAVKTRRPYSNTPYVFSLDTWYHIVFTRLGTKYITYINGTKIAEYTVTDAIPLDSGWSNTAVGRETYAGGYFNLNGKIALVKIYNRALSDEKVTESFELLKPGYGI